MEDTIKYKLIELNKIDTQISVNKEIKKSLEKGMDRNYSALSNLGKSMSKSFSLKSLGSKISDTMNNMTKNISNSFSNIGKNLSNAFSGLKTKLANFSPIAAIKEKFTGLVSKPKEKIKTLIGRNDEQLKHKFYAQWSNPKKIAKIWAKEINKNKSLTTKDSQKAAGITEIGGAIFGIVSKFFTMLNSFISKILIKAVVAFHAAVGPYILLIVGTIILLALLFKDQMKELIPVFGKILSVVATIAELVYGAVGKIISGVADIITGLTSSVVKILMPLSDALGFIARALGGVSEIIYEIINLLRSEILGILKPINIVVQALSPVLEKIANMIASFLTNPVGVLGELGSSIASKVGGVVGTLKDKFSMSNENGFMPIIMKAFNTIKDTLTDLIENMKSTLNNTMTNMGDYFDKSPMLKKISVFFSDGIKEFNELLFKKLDGMTMAFKDNSGSQRFFNTSLAKMNQGFTDMKTWLHDNVSVKEKNPLNNRDNTQVENENPFNALIQGFEKMRKDTVVLLSEIQASVANIEKDKIQIGLTPRENYNYGNVSDSQNTNSLQNIQLNNNVDLTKVLDKMDNTNDLLNSIVMNTALKDDGSRKQNSVWTIG